MSRAIVALILFHRAVGCTPSPGSEGGKCEQGCNRDYCENGLECDALTDKCVQPPSLSPPGSSGCNFNGADQRCASGQIGYNCFNGSTPMIGESDVPGCASTSQTDRAGNILYCCTPSCAERLTPRCGAPSSTYFCSGDATPEDEDSSKRCYSLLGYWGVAEYCCASSDTCFEGPSDLFLTPDCRDGDLVLCTGSSTPSLAGKACSAVAIQDGGVGVSGYCCSAPIADTATVD